MWQGREYNKHRKQMEAYAEAATQFIIGFETIKSTVNFNADIQRETIEKVNTQNKTLATIMLLLEMHDTALNLKMSETILRSLEENILLPKKEEE
jgi:hypothetical protein